MFGQTPPPDPGKEHATSPLTLKENKITEEPPRQITQRAEGGDYRLVAGSDGLFVDVCVTHGEQ